MTVWGNGSKTKPGVSSKYGPRIGGAFTFHYGTDFIGYTQLKSLMAGTVTFAGYMNAAAGNAIVVDSKLPDGRTVTICRFHVAAIGVQRGQKVSEGQYLGTMGKTGNANGNCDHLEIRFWVNGKKTTVDPEVWIADRIRNEAGAPASTGGVSMNRTTRPTKDIQTLVGTTADGIWGDKTTAAVKTWQAAHKLTADGIWGDLSDAVGFAIKVDGDWGDKTTAKLQANLGVTVDGERGPATTKALQTLLGVTVDGDWGPATTKAMQANLGVTQDGEIGPATTKALQTFLNAGKKFTKQTTTPAPAPEKITLPARVARPVTYPNAVRAWTPPYAYRIKDGKPNVRPGGKITGVALHHTGSTADQEAFFTSQNDRVSCPNVYVNEKAEIIELVPYHLQPSSTGGANDYTIAIEVENITGDPTWGISDAQHEAIARFLAWLSTQLTLGTVPVHVPLTRDAIKGHREFPTTANGTICPGPSMNIDRIVARAKEIATPPAPAPDTLKDEILAALTTLTALVQKL